MADDAAVLSIRTEYDGSSLNIGIKESSAAVTASSVEMAESLQGVATANAEVIASATAAVTAHTEEVAASAAAKAATKAEAEAKHELAAQTREATHAAHLFGMETGVEIPRALRGTLAQSAVLGPALAAMFPLLAAVGFVDIIIKAGKEAYEWGEKGFEAATKIGEGFDDLSRKETESNDQIEVTNAKLQQQIDKIEKKPNNGLAVALAETAVAADKLADHLRSALEVSNKLLKDQTIGAAKGAVLGLATTGPAEDLVKDLQAQQNKAEGQKTWAMSQASTLTGKAQQDAILKAQTAFTAEQLRIAIKGRDEGKRLADETEAEVRKSVGSDPARQKAALGEYGGFGARIAAFRGIQGEMGAAVTGMQGSQTTETLQSHLGKDEQAKENAENAKRATEEAKRAKEAADRLKEKENELSRLKLELSNNGMKAMADSLTSMPKGAELANINKVLETYKHGVEEAGKVGEEAAKKKSTSEIDALEAQKKKDEVAQKSAEIEQKYQETVAAGEEIRTKATEDLKLQSVQSELASGRISALGAAQAEAAIHAEEHRTKLEALDAEMLAIYQNPYTSSDQMKLEGQKKQNQIDQEKGAGNVSATGDQSKVAQQIAAPYQQAAKIITSSAATGFNGWIDGSKKLSAAMIQSAKSMEMAFIQSVERMGEKWIQEHILMAIASKVFHASDSSDDKAAATQKRAADQAASNVVMATGDAGLAAAGTFAFYSAIDPPIAMEMAMAAYEEGMAFAGLAAFENGGIAGQGLRYGSSVPIIAHAGERILTTGQTQKFDSMVNNRTTNTKGGSMSMTNHFHNSNDPKAVSDQVFAKMLRYQRSSGVRR
jgi:hypothetical protein